ncbi:hypothetical protein QR680_002197 [Steinernema hermaphroditum]|uniref:GPI inositol-deacylase n=1 Tax=Steinernema hermaphroditum TaxID=289476 RepID=A0AA39H1T2_9BILA|nr:hypothetical protein QR680_002197 [Steinernema hermaphroditum]
MFKGSTVIDVGVKSAFSALFLGGRLVNRNGDGQDRKVIKAIEDLNNGQNAKNAVAVLERLSSDQKAESIKQLNALALCILGASESSLCQVASDSRAHRIEIARPQLMERLETISLDNDWNKALLWYSVDACGEEDLACSNETLLNRPRNIQKLMRLLRILSSKTELNYSSSMVDQGVLDVLYEVFQHYRQSNLAICAYILKILANIVMDGAYCADAVVHSQWMATLLELLSHKNEEIQITTKKIFLNVLYSLQVKETSLGPDLYELYCTPYCSKPEVDIVLLHGMRGGAFRSWRQKDNPSEETVKCWPKAWLPRDVKGHFRIVAVDYPSALYGGDLMENLHARASRVYDLLKRAGIGDRSVVFICHSMGGLLAKQILINSPSLRENTVGILFMATPHYGTPVAKDYLFEVFRPTTDFKMLIEGNEANKKLHADFLEQEPRVPLMLNVSESVESPLFGKVKSMLVPSLSSSFPGCGLYHVPEMHHNVCKPADVNALSYKIVLKFIEDVLHYTRTHSKVNHSC